jgi:hypothetical protein
LACPENVIPHILPQTAWILFSKTAGTLYTSNSNGHKKYYENNYDKVKEKAKKYMERIKEENPEKIKEWRKNAYLKRKDKQENKDN